MLRKIFLAAMLALSTPAFADDWGRTEFETTVCYDYHRNPRVCGNLWYCQYDYRTDLCLYVDDDVRPRDCSSYDYDPYLCDRQAGCRWDDYSRRCRDAAGPGPGPGPSQCWHYNNDPRSCDRTPGCSWDNRTRTCQDDWNHDPDPIGTTTVNCASSQYRFKRCTVRGTIESAYLLRQTSSASCVEGRTWGYDYDGIWVDQGCAGSFKVRLRRNH